MKAGDWIEYAWWSVFGLVCAILTAWSAYLLILEGR